MIRFIFEIIEMKKILFAFVVSLFASYAVAQESVDYYFKKGSGKVYVFGVSQMLTDSIVYISPIQEIAGIDLQKKTKFLPYRSEFSMQMKQYLEGELHLQKQTACTFYASTRKKASKIYYRIKKRYLDNPKTKIFMVDGSKFAFVHPADAYNEQK